MKRKPPNIKAFKYRKIQINIPIKNKFQIHMVGLLGLFDKNNSLTISNEIARNIFKDYYLFYLNWSNHFYNLKKEKKRFKSAQFTFSPKINKNSDTLSRNYRDIVKIVKIFIIL